MVCGATDEGGIRWPDVGNADVPCCWGATIHGPSHCECWEPVYDLEQTDPSPDAPGLCAQPCTGCAYRGGSPERTGDPRMAAGPDDLAALVDGNHPFFCHQGMRRIVAFRHPSGAVHQPDDLRLEAAYRPHIINGVPYRADGHPADLCAGWAAARLRVRPPEATP